MLRNRPQRGAFPPLAPSATAPRSRDRACTDGKGVGLDSPGPLPCPAHAHHLSPSNSRCSSAVAPPTPAPPYPRGRSRLGASVECTSRVCYRGNCKYLEVPCQGSGKGVLLGWGQTWGCPHTHAQASTAAGPMGITPPPFRLKTSPSTQRPKSLTLLYLPSRPSSIVAHPRAMEPESFQLTAYLPTRISFFPLEARPRLG